jgi:hypothetical protein
MPNPRFDIPFSFCLSPPPFLLRHRYFLLGCTGHTLNEVLFRQPTTRAHQPPTSSRDSGSMSAGTSLMSISAQSGRHSQQGKARWPHSRPTVTKPPWHCIKFPQIQLLGRSSADASQPIELHPAWFVQAPDALCHSFLPSLFVPIRSNWSTTSILTSHIDLTRPPTVT